MFSDAHESNSIPANFSLGGPHGLHPVQSPNAHWGFSLQYASIAEEDKSNPLPLLSPTSSPLPWAGFLGSRKTSPALHINRLFLILSELGKEAWISLERLLCDSAT